MTLDDLDTGPSPAHGDARRFCLDVIREFYGFEYRADWHADLDALAAGGAGNPYARANGGAFLLLRDDAGAIVAIVARVYVRRERRGAGDLAWRTPQPSPSKRGTGAAQRRQGESRGGRKSIAVVAARAFGLSPWPLRGLSPSSRGTVGAALIGRGAGR